MNSTMHLVVKSFDSNVSGLVTDNNADVIDVSAFTLLDRPYWKSETTQVVASKICKMAQACNRGPRVLARPK